MHSSCYFDNVNMFTTPLLLFVNIVLIKMISNQNFKIKLNIYTVSQKMFCHNFVKYWPVFETLSLLLSGKFAIKRSNIRHHTSPLTHRCTTSRNINKKGVLSQGNHAVPFVSVLIFADIHYKFKSRQAPKAYLCLFKLKYAYWANFSIRNSELWM